jgi:hypothetical protein
MLKVITYIETVGDDIIALATAEPMADAIGCEPEHRSAYAGQWCVEIDRVTAKSTGEDVFAKLTTSDIAFIESEFVKNLPYCR